MNPFVGICTWPFLQTLYFVYLVIFWTMGYGPLFHKRGYWPRSALALSHVNVAYMQSSLFLYLLLYSLQQIKLILRNMKMCDLI